MLSVYTLHRHFHLSTLLPGWLLSVCSASVSLNEKWTLLCYTKRATVSNEIEIITAFGNNSWLWPQDESSLEDRGRFTWVHLNLCLFLDLTKLALLAVLVLMERHCLSVSSFSFLFIALSIHIQQMLLLKTLTFCFWQTVLQNHVEHFYSQKKNYILYHNIILCVG